ncbi:FAD:protein FMN transferase [Fulvivirga maritima]|uniref:FAD:protein FMN transferase n=1 Tax=Fulvivirga maritima TaxID=2904247 RepID=UPI001F209E95|nr:FAD:protein FMN transferase [Fulvivirga maritima]UII25956.1 FAD:protein FMN transferase [Fulvivirga maritima]
MSQTASKLYISQTRELYHCHIKIKIPMEYGEELLEDCFALLEVIDKTYNSYQEGSYFHNINAEAGNWVNTDQPTIEMISLSKKISEIMHGTYDITSMPLIRLWGFYQENNTAIPEAEDIRKTLAQVDYEKIKIHENKVKIEANQEIITGSFIKSYAVDCVVEKLKAAGVTDAIINAGGITIYALNDESHPQWHVNIPHYSDNKETLSRIALSNSCFSLSARKSNYIEIDGKQYGHILNAKTGLPSANLQVGVLSPTTFIGDMLSTALFAHTANAFAINASNLRHHFDFQAYLIDENAHFQHLDFNLFES